MSKVKIINFDLLVTKQVGEGRERTINALKEIYEKYTVLGRHDKSGDTYYIVRG